MKTTSRKDFLKGAFALGGLVATAELPAFGAAPAAAGIFAKRGGYERLSLAYAHVHIGLAKPFSVLHLSDTHLTAAYDHEHEDKRKVSASRTQTFGGHQEEALRDSLSWAKSNVDYVVHTGDLIDWQSEANFDLVKKYYGDRMFGSMGNHEFYTYMPDEKHTWKEPFKDRSWPLLKSVYPVDARFGAHVVNGVNFIAIDDVFGTVQPDQVEKFHAEVKKGLPIVLCMHVPFHTDDLWRYTHKYWSLRGRTFSNAAVPDPTGDYKRQLEDPVTNGFVQYLRREPLLKAILAGHQHLHAEDQFSPTAREYIVAGNYMFAGREVLFT